MQIIALIGESSVGKSETLNIVYLFMLHFGYIQVSGHFSVLNSGQKDFRDILELKGERIGIATMGDYDKAIIAENKSVDERLSVEWLITYFQNNDCTKVVCACNKHLASGIAFIETFPHIFVDKTVTNNSAEQRIRNGEDAENIYSLI